MNKDIIKFGKLLYDKDLTSATSGNISCKCGDKIFITSTGSALGLLQDDDVVEIDFNGNEIKNGKKASSEKFLHIEIYKMRSDVNAIIHCHSPFSTAFGSPVSSLSSLSSPGGG